MPIVTVEVEVSMTDFDDEDIRDEFESRGLQADFLDGDDDFVQRAKMLLQQGRKDEALELLRQKLEEVTGTVIVMP